MDVKIRVEINGPVFNGHATRVVDEFLEEAKDKVGQQGLADLHFYMNAYFKDPTPYYELQVLVERQADDVVIHDNGMVYGPWLAGVGSRNQTTSFKGYPHWRRTVSDLERKAPAIAERVLQRYLDRMQ